MGRKYFLTNTFLTHTFFAHPIKQYYRLIIILLYLPFHSTAAKMIVVSASFLALIWLSGMTGVDSECLYRNFVHKCLYFPCDLFNKI